MYFFLTKRGLGRGSSKKKCQLFWGSNIEPVSAGFQGGVCVLCFCLNELKLKRRTWKQDEVHPGKLTCHLKRDQLNRKYIFQPLIFRGHVSFRGSNGGNNEHAWMSIKINLAFTSFEDFFSEGPAPGWQEPRKG